MANGKSNPRSVLSLMTSIVGRYRDDFGVLQIAHAFEQVTAFGSTRPAVDLT